MTAGLSAAQAMATVIACNKWNTSIPRIGLLVAKLTAILQEHIDMGMILQEARTDKRYYIHTDRGCIIGSFGGKRCVIRLASYHEVVILHSFVAESFSFFEVVLDASNNWGELKRFSDPLAALIKGDTK